MIIVLGFRTKGLDIEISLNCHWYSSERASEIYIATLLKQKVSFETDCVVVHKH